MKLESKLQKRWAEFRDQYPDYDDLLFIDAIDSANERLSAIFGSEASTSGILACFRASGIAVPDDTTLPAHDVRWSIDELQKLQVYKDLVAVHAYAFFGLPMGDDVSTADYLPLNPLVGDYTREESLKQIQEIRIGSLIEKLESQARDGHFLTSSVRQTIDAAYARWELDEGGDDAVVTPEQLAALALVSVKSIRNLMAPSGGDQLRAMPDGTIPVTVARRWLKARKGFRSSVWQYSESAQAYQSVEDAEPTTLEDVHFVPVARDGSWFSPDHNRNGQYLIGAKGQECPFDDYFSALAYLNSMEVPRWRRPNAEGNWRIVSGIRWARRTLAELQIH